MVIGMFLAHLVGDFVLQWDGLAQRKSREWGGVLVHSLIVLGVTATIALLLNPLWWAGVLIIGLTHFAIDALWFVVRSPLSPLMRFIVDQALHGFFILLALVVTGYLSWGDLWGGIMAGARATPWLTALLAYVFLTMPAWVLLKFTTRGMKQGSSLDFSAGLGKFTGIGERLIVMTLVLLGQWLVAPLVVLPQLIVLWPRENDDRSIAFELVIGVALAAAVGWLIRPLLP